MHSCRNYLLGTVHYKSPYLAQALKFVHKLQKLQNFSKLLKMSGGSNLKKKPIAAISTNRNTQTNTYII